MLPLLSFRPRSLYAAVVARCSSWQAACDRFRVSSRESECQDSFEAAGIQTKVAASLRDAFPNIREPTAMQKKLICAITKDQDVFLQDDTGTGKSFAAMLALLSKHSTRKMSLVMGEDKPDTREAPTSLLIVPHRDLAYQYLHWIHHMTLPGGSSLAKHAQVLVRHVNKSTLGGLPVRMQEAIRSTTSDQDLLTRGPWPRILIATPNAILELAGRQNEWFRSVLPSTVVVDEVDALLRVPTNKRSEERGRAHGKKLAKHIPDLVRILDRLYPPSRGKDHTTPARRPQLVLISATLRSRLQNALFGTLGWVRRGKVVKLIRKRSSALPSHRLDRSAVHHVLVVSKTGDIKNIAGARPLQSNVGDNVTLIEKDHDDDEGCTSYDDDPEVVDEVDKDLAHVPLAFDPAMLEAVAATFALDVPRVALLVLPATAAVRKIIFELRQLGVNAHPLDLVENEVSRGHVLSRIDGAADENPALIVATLATVRGIDIPDLSHVFMLGVPEGRSGDAYLHVAGRVGRFGRHGKVITVLEQHKEERIGNKIVARDDPRKLGILLSQIGVQPSRLEHFD